MSKPLKIAMFFSYDPSQAGGVQEHIHMLSDYLRKLGHSVDIYGPENDIYNFKNYFSVAKSIEVPVPNGSWANITVDLDKNSNLTEQINKKKYDLIHIHDPHVPFVVWEIMKKTKAKKIATFHTAWENNSIINFINPFITLFQDSFSSSVSGGIFVSKIVKKRWSELCGRKVKQIVIHNGVDKIFVPTKKLEADEIKILFLGRLVEKKGPKYLLEAFAKVLKYYPKTKLTFVGKGKLLKELVDFAKKKKIQKNVIFAGEVMGEKRIKYYQEANIFCAPYSDEAFGLTVIEAMATGTPIVGFANSAFKEILNGYPNPELLVKSRDVNQLTVALTKIIGNKEMRKKLSSWLIVQSRQYNWEKIAKETEEFYRKVLR